MIKKYILLSIIFSITLAGAPVLVHAAVDSQTQTPVPATQTQTPIPATQTQTPTTAATTQTTPVPTATTPTPTSAATSPATTGNFVPLTSLPFLQNVVSATQGATDTGLIGFFNSLFKICIGVCAALALFQIIRAGLLYMSAGDSTQKVSQARELIKSAILGLVLVLAPVIVFSIINPKILNLNIDFSQIAPGSVAPVSTAATASTAAGVTTNTLTGDQTASCTNQGGTAELMCIDLDGVASSPGTSKSCAAGQSLQTKCTLPQATADANSCSIYEVDEYGPVKTNQTCGSTFEHDGDSEPIPTVCCDDSSTPEPGYICCGHKK